MDKFIHVRSAKFPILPGEKEELVNDGIYGKALALYLQQRLIERGYLAPFICCEDWGWWVELRSAPFTFGVCVYGGPDEGPLDLFCTDSTHTPKEWSWRKFRFIETAPYANKLYEDLISIFRADPEVQLLNTAADSPFPDESELKGDNEENRLKP